MSKYAAGMLWLLLLGSNLYGQEVKVDPKPVEPKVEDVKIVVPKGVLGEGKRLSPYVFDINTKCYLSLPLTNAESIKSLRWIKDDGPPDLEAIGPETPEAASLHQGFSLANPGLYLVEADWDKGFAKIWLEIKGSGPSPPPNPLPPNPGPVPPGPVDPPAPIVTTGFRVIFAYELWDKLSKGQADVMLSPRIRKYLNAKCSKGTDGIYKDHPEYRFWDKTGKDKAKDSASIKKMWADLTPNLPGGSNPTDLPFMAVEANGKQVVFPLRADVTIDQVMTKLVELGGPE